MCEEGAVHGMVVDEKVHGTTYVNERVLQQHCPRRISSVSTGLVCGLLVIGVGVVSHCLQLWRDDCNLITFALDLPGQDTSGQVMRVSDETSARFIVSRSGGVDLNKKNRYQYHKNRYQHHAPVHQICSM
jgi:hypothetical protein